MSGLEILIYGFIGLVACFYAVFPAIGYLMERIVASCLKEKGTYERYMSLGMLFVASLICVTLMGYNAYAVLISFITLW